MKQSLSDGLGPALNIITWVAMIIMILAVVAKLSSKFVKNSKLMLDDLLLTMAMVWLRSALLEQHSYSLSIPLQRSWP